MMEETFLDFWGQYSQAIVNYAEATKTKSRELKHALREEDYEGMFCTVYILGGWTHTFFSSSYVMWLNGTHSPTDSMSLKAARCLVYFLTVKNKKKVNAVM